MVLVSNEILNQNFGPKKDKIQVLLLKVKQQGTSISPVRQPINSQNIPESHLTSITWKQAGSKNPKSHFPFRLYPNPTLNPYEFSNAIQSFGVSLTHSVQVKT